MQYRLSMQRAAARALSFVRRKPAACLVLALLALAPALAQAVVPAPMVTSITPNSGPKAGGTVVTLNGTDFAGAISVKFGATNATFSVMSATAISATVPPATNAGVVDVTVTTPGGTSSTSSADRFTYLGLPVVRGFLVGYTYAPQVQFDLGPFTQDATGYALASAPSHGTVILSGSWVTYLPNAGYVGPDSFYYTASNAEGTSAPARVSLEASPPTISYTPSFDGVPAVVGTAYSRSLAGASGGNAPYSYQVTGTLPPGLSLSTNGTLAGTPTTAGIYTFNVFASDSSTGTGPFDSGTVTFSMVVAPQAAAISPGSLSGGTAGVPYNATLAVTGGSGAYTMSVTSGSLPTGLSLSSGGVLFGIPATSGNSSFTVTATNGSGDTVIANYTLSIIVGRPGAPSSIAATAGDGQATVSFVPPASNGGSAITLYTVTASPGGSTGSGSGSPLTVTGLTNGSGYVFSVTATNAAGQVSTPSANSAVVIPQGPQTITFYNPGAQTWGTQPTLTATASSGLPVTFTSLTPAICTITNGGSLTTVAPGTCTIQADQAGNAAFRIAPAAFQSFNIAVPGGAVTFTTDFLPTLTPGQALAMFIGATGGARPYSFQVVGGGLPNGVTLDPGGLFSGEPTQVGTFNFDVRVTDAAGQTATRSYALTVTPPTITIGPSTIGPFTVGLPVSQQVGASGGTAPHSFAVTSGALPDGLTLDGAGSLSGTPTASGFFNFTITATDAGGYTGTVSYGTSVAGIAPGAPTIGTATAADSHATVSFTPPASTGGSAITDYTVTASPGGASASGAASPVTLTGLTNGTAYTFTVSATNAAGIVSAPSAASNAVTPRGTQVITFTNPGSQNFGTTVPLVATVASGLTVTFSSSTINVCRVTSGNMVSSLAPGTCTILAEQPGSAAYLPAASVSQSFQIVVPGGAVSLGTPSLLPSALVRAAYSYAIVASGGAMPYSFQVFGGRLPNGLVFSPTGVLSGTATEAGTFGFVVQVTDSAGQTAQKTVQLVVIAPTLTITPGRLPDSVVGEAYSQTLSTNGGAAPYTYAVTTGVLPTGITLMGSTLQGTPTADGSFNFTVTTTDADGFQSSQAYTVVIAVPTLVFSPGSLPTATGGSAYSQTLSVNGGIGPYAYELASGALPTGVSLSTTGTLSGVSTVSGSFGFTVKATDKFGYSGTQAYTLQVDAPGITVSPGTLAGGTAGIAYAQTLTATGGTAPYTYSRSGTLPAGMNVSAAGELAGTPTASGTFNFTVIATDRFGFHGTQAYSLVIGAPTISFTQASLAGGTAGTAYAGTLSVTGGTAPYTYAVTSGALPTGMLLSVAGALSGTPTVSGSFPVTVTATDNYGFTANHVYTLAIGAPAIGFAQASLSNGTAGTAYAQTLSANGGTAPYTYAVTAGALPAGMSLSTAGALGGTPTVAGNFNVTVTATDKFGFTGAQAYALAIDAPVVRVVQATLPGGIAGTAYAQTLTATGGTAPYTFAVTAGALPTGLGLSGAGAISGTPTTAGSFNATVTATDKYGFKGVQAYTVAIGEPAPVAVADNASVNANGTISIAVADNDSGPITRIAITRQPAHGTATVNGLEVQYTPAHDYFGKDTLAYTATGPGGTSAAAEVSLTVVPGAVPGVVAQQATVLAGQSVTVQLAANASNGPFTGATIVAAPEAGTATLQGTELVYAADADSAGTFGLDYTVSNAFGASQPAHLTLTVNPRPVAPALSATAIAGTTVQLELTTGAQGGPFTAAQVVSVSPADAGSATVQASAQGYTLAFAAAATFSGVAQVSFTLGNAYATSAPGVASISVTSRSDPSKDVEVMGILDAQADAARRMATGQIGNFQRRMESLHGGRGQGSAAGFSNGITLSSASAMRNANALPEMQHVMGGGDLGAMAADDTAAASSPASTSQAGAPGGLAFWSGGAINFGKMEPGASSGNGIDFSTSGLSLGADKWISPSLALGMGLGYGHDDSDIGQHGSRSRVDSYNVAFYGSFQPGTAGYLDAMVGYQWLQFDARRHVTDNGGMVEGSRDGDQWFASISTGYVHAGERLRLTPYGRLDIARASLDAYAESGDPVYALDYQAQTIRTTTASLGLLGQWTLKRDHGTWMPQLRAEYGRDLQGSSYATMRYLDVLNGPLYQATLRNQSRDHGLLGAGLSLQTLKGWLLRAEYQANLDDSSQDNQSILLGIEKKLQP